MNIVVLAGGMSPQREVSLAAGTNVCAALREAGHHAILVDAGYGVSQLMAPVSAAFAAEPRLEVRTVGTVPPEPETAGTNAGDAPFPGRNTVPLCKAADITFLALCGGDGENGRLQAFFDMQGIRYTGPGYAGCALAINKHLTKRVLRSAGIPVAEGTLMRESELRDLGELQPPLVVKPCCGGSSVGLSVVRDEMELANALCEAFRYEQDAVLERFIPGREVSCTVLGGRALPVAEVRPKNGCNDYAHKYRAENREVVVPAPIGTSREKLVKEYAVAAAKELQLEVCARFDFILPDGGEPILLEANALPELTQTSLTLASAAAEGMDLRMLAERITELSLEKYR